MRTIFIGFVLFALCCFFGCTSSKQFVYFNDLDRDSGSVSNVAPAILVQPGDILQVTISTLDKDISTFFNPSVINANSGIAGGSIQQGYLVDKGGFIDLPMIGKVKVANNSSEQVTEIIRAEVNKTLKNAFVSTRLLNFKVSVLGDVAKPGSFSVANERITLLEALSLAGDLNITALRDDVVLIREAGGRQEYRSVNLNDSKLLSSPYYFLRNNDVIYVKPGPNKSFSSTRGYQLLPIVLSGLSLITVIISSVIR